MDGNNKQTSSQQITLADTVKLFRGKLKLLFCIALAACIAGAALGVFMTYSDISYGGKIEFYLDPADSSNRLLPMLRADSFAEKLLLDENGLPPKEDCDPDDYKAALEAVVAAREARERKQELKRELDSIPYEIAVVEDEYNNKTDEYNRIRDLLNIYKSASDIAVEKDPEHQDMVDSYEDKLETATEDKKKAEESYNSLIQKKLEKEQEYHLASLDLKEKNETADAALEKILRVWRDGEDVRSKMDVIKKALSFEYAKTSSDTAKADDANKPNAAFLIISVSLSNDKEFAEELIDSITRITPAFAEKSLEEFAYVNKAKCVLISTFASAEDTEPESIVKNIVIYTVVVAAAALLMSCFIIIAKGFMPSDPSDKCKNKKDTGAAK